MVGVRSLSDEELHAQLLELGITTPVTATTRPLLLKKLMQAKQTRTKVSILGEVRNILLFYLQTKGSYCFVMLVGSGFFCGKCYWLVSAQ